MDRAVPLAKPVCSPGAQGGAEIGLALPHRILQRQPSGQAGGNGGGQGAAGAMIVFGGNAPARKAQGPFGLAQKQNVVAIRPPEAT